MKYASGYLELTLKYGALSRHPLFANMRPELRHPAFRRVSISRSHKFCYFRVPKAANSTIIQTLQVNMNPELIADADTPFPKHALHGVPHLYEMPGLFVFTVVRNPITRLLSAYLQKTPQEKYINKYRLYLKNKRQRLSFEDFLHKLRDELLYKDIHWAPQTSILPYNIKQYDYIGKFENLESDLNFINSEIFSRKTGVFTVNHHKTESQDLLAQISRRELNILQNLYERDFIEFGYDA